MSADDRRRASGRRIAAAGIVTILQHRGDLAWDTLLARFAPGSAMSAALKQWVSKIGKIPEGVQNVSHTRGGRAESDYAGWSLRRDRIAGC